MRAAAARARPARRYLCIEIPRIVLAVVNGPREGETTGSREFHLPAHADVSRRPIVCAYPGPTQVTRPAGHPGSCAATHIGSPPDDQKTSPRPGPEAAGRVAVGRAAGPARPHPGPGQAV